MNRNARREKHNLDKVYSKAVDKLTPMQTQFINKLAIQKASTMIQNISKIINDCIFSAARESHVSEERANMIIERTEELIQLESRK
jgi:hypothetical protein